MQFPDLINGLFEFFGSIAMWYNVLAIYRDKKFSGVRMGPYIFFTSWGIWNLYYYPHLNQWISFAAGCSIGWANVAYVCLMIKYRKNK